jgi:hypothetical protein
MITSFAKKCVTRFSAATACSLFLFSIAALAGPPLVCHVFDIGGAKSLPWTSSGWNLTGRVSYDTKNLADATIAILNSDSTVLVHMETLRRATLYARKDPATAKQLLTKLELRSESAKTSSQSALAKFDEGYLVETYKQWIGQNEQNPAQGLDGYTLVKSALQARGEDAQINFAAALITLQGPEKDHKIFAEKAMAGAEHDVLLARNLASKFHGSQSETMAELISGQYPEKVAARQ